MSDDVKARYELVDTVLNRKADHRAETEAAHPATMLLALMEDHTAILSLEQRPQRQDPAFAIA
jgi:hypothetical protein